MSETGLFVADACDWSHMIFDVAVTVHSQHKSAYQSNKTC